jgi:hypothetical protein
MPVHAGPETHNLFCTRGTVSFSEKNKRSGRVSDPTPSSSPEAANGLSLNTRPTSVCVCVCYEVNCTFTLITL